MTEIVFDRINDTILDISKHSIKPLSSFVSNQTAGAKKSLLAMGFINLAIFILRINPEKIRILGNDPSEVSKYPELVLPLLLGLHLYFIFMFMYHARDNIKEFKKYKQVILRLHNLKYVPEYSDIRNEIQGRMTGLTNRLRNALKGKDIENKLKLIDKLDTYDDEIKIGFATELVSIESYGEYFKSEREDKSFIGQLCIDRKYNLGFSICERAIYELDYINTIHNESLSEYNKPLLKTRLVIVEYILPVLFGTGTLIAGILYYNSLQ